MAESDLAELITAYRRRKGHEMDMLATAILVSMGRAYGSAPARGAGGTDWVSPDALLGMMGETL